MMTIHAAKGLEFDRVYIAGFENGMIPIVRDGVDLEEEKRLLYVAMTRAKNYLTFTRPRYRQKCKTYPSQFITFLKSYLPKQNKDEFITGSEKRIKNWKARKSQLKMW